MHPLSRLVNGTLQCRRSAITDPTEPGIVPVFAAHALAHNKKARGILGLLDG